MQVSQFKLAVGSQAPGDCPTNDLASIGEGKFGTAMQSRYADER